MGSTNVAVNQQQQHPQEQEQPQQQQQKESQTLQQKQQQAPSGSRKRQNSDTIGNTPKGTTLCTGSNSDIVRPDLVEAEFRVMNDGHMT